LNYGNTQDAFDHISDRDGCDRRHVKFGTVDEAVKTFRRKIGRLFTISKKDPAD